MSIKATRARKLSIIGDCPGSFDAMIQAIPDAVFDGLTSRQIALLVDANWRLAGASKAIAARSAIAEGGVWDVRRERFVELRATP